MECKLCGEYFVPLHCNQKLCSYECKRKAKRIVQERYKSTEKGQISKNKWVTSERRKQNEEGYRQKASAKEKARIRSRKRYWDNRDNPEYMVKQREYDKKSLQKNYTHARESNRNATKNIERLKMASGMRKFINIDYVIIGRGI